jgi:hypothetical protein
MGDPTQERLLSQGIGGKAHERGVLTQGPSERDLRELGQAAVRE